MKLLIKYPTRGRFKKSLETLKKYIEYANNMDNIRIIVSLDSDDIENIVNKQEYLNLHKNIEIKIGTPEGKISAINRDINYEDFDILLLASDDMIPVKKDYDIIIKNYMNKYFSDLDGVLFFNDGYTGPKLNTLVICGKQYYKRYNYIYNPIYKSFYCDQEFTDEAFKLKKQKYINEIIIKHEHPNNLGKKVNDNVYIKNNLYWESDKLTYESKKKYNYDLSILICTIPKRKDYFDRLVNYINSLIELSSLKIELCYDDTEIMSVGMKRNLLLSMCQGKYFAFIDDDDMITPEYFNIFETGIKKNSNVDVFSLNGIYFSNGYYGKRFFHSFKYKKEITEKTEIIIRYINHLNILKTEIGKQIWFKDISNTEDADYSTRLKNSNLIKTEYTHGIIQYLYYYNSKNSIQKIVKQGS